MSIHYRYAPYDLRSQSWEMQKEKITKTTLSVLEDYAPGISKLVLESKVISPKDYEQDYGLTEGNLSQGQMGLDQLILMRPVPGFSAYRSPVDGLYLCGASSHPGGGGAPYLAGILPSK
jgi:phytoene dehydrogenase-like protein